jgi:Uncharacterized protein conserved in bacteria (DUF2200)
LTGYGQKELGTQLEKQTDFETFFAKAPKMNPSRALIKGVVCGVRVEDIKEPTMQEIRYLDKLIDELAQGKTMDKILRKKMILSLVLSWHKKSPAEAGEDVECVEYRMELSGSRRNGATNQISATITAMITGALITRYGHSRNITEAISRPRSSS